VTHIDFSEPYCDELRNQIIECARELKLNAAEAGTYAATQGPRLETRAEIDKLEKDGCHIVGMTGMPEAALARELDICYATIAVVANRAAGRTKEELTMEMIEHNLSAGMGRVRELLENVIPKI
ncbi:MAG: MTAP family purine nucleoside phosphorylase, partial [Gammaproteobacteria bacterium]|nr:MTAP family purine nucleoside phosphorylase [Gammaproteobacteria bacterium]